MKNFVKAFSAFVLVGIVAIGFGGWYQGLNQPSYTMLVTGSSAISMGSATATNITGLSAPVAANQNYTLDCDLTWQATASGTAGPKYTVTGPASVTAAQIGLYSPVTGSTSVNASALGIGSGNTVANTGTVTTATSFTDHLELGLQNGSVAGTLQVQAQANSGTGSVSFQPSDFCKFQ